MLLLFCGVCLSLDFVLFSVDTIEIYLWITFPAGSGLLARAVVSVSRPVVAVCVQLDLIGELVVEFDLILLG